MPQRLTLAQLNDLADDPRLQNLQVREQVFAKLDPADRQWIEQATAKQGPTDYSKLPQQLAGQALDYAKENPRKTGAMVGGIVGPALVTGGASLPVSLAASFLGGAGGAGLGMIEDAGRQYFGGTPSSETLPTSATETASLMGQEGATQAAGDLTGRAVGGALKMGGNALMDSALGSQAKLRGNFPDVNIADTLNSNAINPFRKSSGPISDVVLGGGQQKAGLLRRTSSRETQRIANEASARGVVIRRSDVEPYLSGSQHMAADDAAANLPGGTQQITDAVDQLFGGRSPLGTGDIRANQAPSVTRSLQRRGRAAQASADAGDLPKGLDASVHKDLASGVRQTANAKIGPAYEASNAKTQGLIAAEKVAKRGSRQPLQLPSLKATALGGGAGGLGVLSGDPVTGMIAGAVPLALSVPQISAPTAITLYRTGKIPYALLLKVIGPEVAHAAGITPP